MTGELSHDAIDRRSQMLEFRAPLRLDHFLRGARHLLLGFRIALAFTRSLQSLSRAELFWDFRSRIHPLQRPLGRYRFQPASLQSDRIGHTAWHAFAVARFPG